VSLYYRGKLSSKTAVTDGSYTEGKEVVAVLSSTLLNTQEVVDECQHYPDFEYGGQIQVRLR